MTLEEHKLFQSLKFSMFAVTEYLDMVEMSPDCCSACKRDFERGEAFIDSHRKDLGTKALKCVEELLNLYKLQLNGATNDTTGGDRPSQEADRESDRGPESAHGHEQGTAR